VTDQFVRTEVKDHIATVWLDRPPVNAVNAAVMQQIHDTFNGFDTNPDVHVAILASAIDRIFSAGADIKEASGGTERPAPPLDGGRTRRERGWEILDCAVPVIAAVNGPALGSGCGFALRSDIIVASERAVFGMPEVSVGLLGGGAILQRLIGTYRMREMYFCARRVGAAEMWQMGGISMVVPHEELMTEALRIAEVIAGYSPVAIRLAKEALNRVEYLPLKDAYRLEQDYTERLMRHPDSAEARQAFLERRPPQHEGQ
jgi:enoyl-CoA hydratase